MYWFYNKVCFLIFGLKPPLRTESSWYLEELKVKINFRNNQKKKLIKNGNYYAKLKITTVHR